MNQRLQTLLIKENIEKVMVLTLSILFFFVLKGRFTKEKPVTATSSPARIESTVTRNGAVTEQSSPAVGTPRRPLRYAVREPLQLPDAPPALKRDLFYPINPDYDPLEMKTGGSANPRGWILEAILFDTQKPLAIISGDVVGIGDEIGRSKVARIGPDQVTLSSGRGERILTLKEDHQP